MMHVACRTSHVAHRTPHIAHCMPHATAAHQEREALNVEHVHLIDKEHARHELGDALAS